MKDTVQLMLLTDACHRADSGNACGLHGVIIGLDDWFFAHRWKAVGHTQRLFTLLLTEGILRGSLICSRLLADLCIEQVLAVCGPLKLAAVANAPERVVSDHPGIRAVHSADPDVQHVLF